MNVERVLSSQSVVCQLSFKNLRREREKREAISRSKTRSLDLSRVRPHFHNKSDRQTDRQTKILNNKL